MNPRPGFTLIEVLIVITIIAVLVAIAVPLEPPDLHVNAVALGSSGTAGRYSMTSKPRSSSVIYAVTVGGGGNTEGKVVKQ